MTNSTSEVNAERLAKLHEAEALLHRDLLALAGRLRTSAVGLELIPACEIEQRIQRYVERFGDSDRLDRHFEESFRGALTRNADLLEMTGSPSLAVDVPAEVERVLKASSFEAGFAAGKKAQRQATRIALGLDE